MLSKPFSHQRIVLSGPAVDSVLRNWNHSCVPWAWESGQMLCIAQNHVSSVCAGRPHLQGHVPALEVVSVEATLFLVEWYVSANPHLSRFGPSAPFWSGSTRVWTQQHVFYHWSPTPNPACWTQELLFQPYGGKHPLRECMTKWASLDWVNVTLPGEW